MIVSISETTHSRIALNARSTVLPPSVRLISGRVSESSRQYLSPRVRRVPSALCVLVDRSHAAKHALTGALASLPTPACKKSVLEWT